MKKFKVMLSVLMVLIIICVSVVPVVADNTPVKMITSSVSWLDKIEYLVRGEMETASDDEEIPVWVWFKDIDERGVEAMVEKQTGLNRYNLDVAVQYDTSNLSDALSVASSTGSDSAVDKVKTEMKTYLEATKEARAVEQERVDMYLGAKRAIKRNLYVANNTSVLDELGVSSEDITFQSQLTPSSIMKLTKEEIEEVAKSNEVVGIDYYADDIEPAGYENERNTMQVDAVKEQYGLTGDGVNILLADNNYVKSNANNYNEVLYAENVTPVYNKQLYTTEHPVILAEGHDSGHANCTAGILQGTAKDAHIYNPGGTSYSDIEWLLQQEDIGIDLIIVNLGIGKSTYGTYSAHAKWYDALSVAYDVAFVAAAGNSYLADSCWPNLFSPANSFNSIAVGAYSTDGNSANDHMNNYRYGPIVPSELPCYKPDVVGAGNTTSESTPGVAGIVTLLLDFDPTLASKPQAIKAILMASCHRKVNSIETDTQEEMSSGLTQKQGAGAIDAYRALQIVVDGQYGEVDISNTPQQVDSFSLDAADDVNVSIAWFRVNTKPNNSVPSMTQQLGTVNNLKLTVGIGDAETYTSTVQNAGKQLVYMQNLLPNTNYNINVSNMNTDSTESVKCGYAWSKKSYAKPQIELNGKKAQGQTLSTNLSYISGNPIATDLVTYSWKRSNDGVSWQTILGSNSSTYTLTEDDFLKYIKCEATVSSNTLSVISSINATTTTRIIRYGDADMDGVVCSMDSTEIQLYLVGIVEFTQEQLLAADVDGDGSVTNMDGFLIQQYSAFMIDTFPVELSVDG